MPGRLVRVVWVVLRPKAVKQLALFEIGIFTISDVVLLTGIHATRVRRWVEEYSYRTMGGRKFSAPLWRFEHLNASNGDIWLTFDEMLEIRFVHQFREQGVTLAKIKAAIAELRELVGAPYPFSRQKIYTDGASLFMTLDMGRRGRGLYELTGSKNFVFPEVVWENLRTGLIFRNGIAVRWHPCEEARRVLVDPAIAFGQPVIEGTRISTYVLASAYKVEKDYTEVARWFGIGEDAVRDAVLFHTAKRAA